MLEPKAIQHELTILNSPAEPPTVDEIKTWIKTWAEEGISRTALTDGGKEPRPAVVRHLADELECSEEEAEALLVNQEERLTHLLETADTLHAHIEGKRLLYNLKQSYFRRFQDSELRNLLARAMQATGLVDEIQEILHERVLS